MTLTTTVLFGWPHDAIAALITPRIAASTAAPIVPGFATPDGLWAIAAMLSAK